MPECYMCGMETETIYRCKMCGERFCDDCGSPGEKLCLYCLEDEKEDYDENYEEDESWL